jgi:hypothetical protein
MAEFTDRPPQAMAVGDLTGNGQMEAVLAAGGAMAWFEPWNAEAVFNHWTEHLVVDDSPHEESGGADPLALLLGGGAMADPSLGGLAEAEGDTLVNAVFIADLDGDGWNDMVGTLDRGTHSGLSNDALVWFRNTRGD